MTEIRWNFVSEPDREQEYFVAATTGLRIRWWRPDRWWSFLRYDAAIDKQLRAAEDCVAFARRLALFPLNGSTVSVWRDAESLRRFQVNEPHGEAVGKLRADTKDTFRYAHRTCLGRSLPKTWEEVQAYFEP